VLAHVGELKGKMRENFEKYAERIPVARQLVTLKTNVDFESTRRRASSRG